MKAIRIALLIVGLFAPAICWAQVLQQGTITPRHPAMFTSKNVIADGGGAVGDAAAGIAGTQIGELSITNPHTSSSLPWTGLGLFSAPITQGYYSTTMGYDASGNFILDVGSHNVATSGAFLKLNGTNYPIAVASSGISGPGSAVSGAAVGFNGTSGSIVNDPTAGRLILTDGQNSNGVLQITNTHTANTASVAGLSVITTSTGNNTGPPVEGMINVYSLASDAPGVIAGTKGLLYAADFNIAPSVARNNPPYDDADGVVISNIGTASGTEGLYFGHGVVGGGQDWNSTITIDATAGYGLLFGAATLGYGIDLFGGGTATYSNGAIRLPNNSSIFARNSTASGDVGLITLDTSNRIRVGASSTFDSASSTLTLSGSNVGGVSLTGTYSGNGIDLNSATITSGAIRLPNAKGINFRNGVNNADVSLITSDSSNDVLIGSGATTAKVDSTGAVTALVFNSAFDGNTYSSVFNDTAAHSGAKFETFQSNGSTIGSISNNGNTATAYNTSSDKRLKIDRGRYMSSILSKLIVHNFDWRSTGSADVGLFAQEVYELKPQAVTVGGDDPAVKPWQIDYPKFVPDLISGWQQHEGRIEALESKLKELTR